MSRLWTGSRWRRVRCFFRFAWASCPQALFGRLEMVYQTQAIACLEPRSLPSSLSGQCTYHFAQFWRGSPGPPWLLPTAQWTTSQLASGQFPEARRIPPLDVALPWGTFLFGSVLGLRSMPPPPSCWWPVQGGQEKSKCSETGQCLVLNGPLRVNYPRRRKSRGRCTNNLASRPSPGFHGILT